MGMNDYFKRGSEPVTPGPTTSSVSVATGTAAALGATSSALRSVLVQAPVANTAAVYIGGAGVTVLSGIELQPGDRITIEAAGLAAIYAISGSASQTLRVMVL